MRYVLLSLRILSLFSIVLSVAFADNAPDQAIVLPRPHDKTGHALDIMVHKDVVRENYGQKLYRKYCLSCHGENRKALSRAPLTPAALSRYTTISALYPVIKKGCPERDGAHFDTLDSVKAIFIARYIKTPVK